LGRRNSLFMFIVVGGSETQKETISYPPFSFHFAQFADLYVATGVARLVSLEFDFSTVLLAASGPERRGGRPVEPHEQIEQYPVEISSLPTLLNEWKWMILRETMGRWVADFQRRNPLHQVPQPDTNRMLLLPML